MATKARSGAQVDVGAPRWEFGRVLGSDWIFADAYLADTKVAGFPHSVPGGGGCGIGQGLAAAYVEGERVMVCFGTVGFFALS